MNLPRISEKLISRVPHSPTPIPSSPPSTATMGAIPNISSILLLFPIAYHYASLSILEKIIIANTALVSLLYHTSREMDVDTSPNPATILLYTIDHLQIQCGFTYILFRNYDMNPYATFAIYTVVVINDFVDVNSSANKLTALLLLSNVLKTLIQSSATNIALLFVGLCIATRGYQGTQLIDNVNKDELTVWSEGEKCMWHGGMALVIAAIL